MMAVLCEVGICIAAFALGYFLDDLFDLVCTPKEFRR